jgi:two-component system OmpR family response regulator
MPAILKATRPKTVLFVEDDKGLQASLSTVASAQGWEVRGCLSAEKALGVAAEFKPTVIFLDVFFPDGDGRTILAALRADEELHDSQVVLMTGDWTSASRQASIDHQADDYLAKPFSLEEFVACLDERYRQANL